MKLQIKNGRVLTPLEERIADVWIDDGKIVSIGDSPQSASSSSFQVISADGCWVTPGLIDLQVNGGPECDFWADPDKASISRFAESLVRAGVTTILPTLITGEIASLKEHLRFLDETLAVGSKQLKTNAPPLAVRMPGVHLEGPCLSPQKPGVHPQQHLQPLSIEVLKEIVTPIVSLITLAPELDPTAQCIGWLQNQEIVTSLGHSNATHQEAAFAFGHGVKMVTHLFNALPGIHHRNPGAVAAALLDDSVFCCVICDGQHLAPEVVSLVIKAKGRGKTILVTDIAHIGTSQGGLVGSSIMLEEAVRNVVKWKVASFQQAIYMATYNPAVAMGWTDDIGLLASGRNADIVVWDQKTLAIRHVISAGKTIDLRNYASA